MPRLPNTLSNPERVLLICLLMILAFTAISSTRHSASQAQPMQPAGQQAATATAVIEAQPTQPSFRGVMTQPENLVLSNEMLLGATILVLIIVGGSLGTTARGPRSPKASAPPPPPPAA